MIQKFSSAGLPVPSGRLARLLRFGSMTTRIAGNIEQLAINLHHSSLRAKRGNPYTGAASGLPRRCTPRKDDPHFTQRALVIDGAVQFASGQRPALGDLLMTSANALKVTLELGKMPGAAMCAGF